MFLFPILLLLAADGAYLIAKFIARREMVAGAVLPVLLVVPIQSIMRDQIPQHLEHLRPVLDYVRQHQQAGDVIWVYYGAGMAFRYYQHIFPLDATLSTCDRSDPVGQLRQLDALRGTHRAWIIFTHTGANGRADERTPLVTYLDAIGERLATVPASVGANTPPSFAGAILYGLDNEQRLASRSLAQAERPRATGTLWSCYGVMDPDGAALARLHKAVLTEAQRVGLR